MLKLTKISFPLYEYGFPRARRINYSNDIQFFKDFLRQIIIEKKLSIFLCMGMF